MEDFTNRTAIFIVLNLTNGKQLNICKYQYNGKVYFNQRVKQRIRRDALGKKRSQL